MGLSTRAARLRDTTLFASLDDDALERAADLADEVYLPAGYVVVDEDDRADHLLVIASGTATARSPDGDANALGPGTAIGELSRVGWNARRGRVVAATPLRLFMFDADGFADLVTDRPGLLPRSGEGRGGTPRRSPR
jgi:CRP-like cAMP-binding protein